MHISQQEVYFKVYKQLQAFGPTIPLLVAAEARDNVAWSMGRKHSACA